MTCKPSIEPRFHLGMEEATMERWQFSMSCIVWCVNTEYDQDGNEC